MSIFNKYKSSFKLNSSERVFCPAPQLYPTIAWRLPEVVCRILPDAQYEYSISVDDELSITNVCLDSKEVSKIPHELICDLFFGSKSDVKFSTVSVCHDNTDNQSPDIIQCTGPDEFNIIELKTQRGQTIDMIKFDQASQIYRKACEVRTSQKFHLFVVIVSESQILTNLPMTQGQCDQLSTILLLGYKILNSFRDLGWSSCSDDVAYKIQDIKTSLSNFAIPETSNDPLIITREDVKRWRSCDESVANKILMKEYMSSMEEANDDISIKNREIANGRLDKYFALLKPGRIDNKSPIQMPLFLSSRAASDFKDLLSIQRIDAISNLWWQAALFQITHPDRWKEVEFKSMLSYSLEECELASKPVKETHFRIEAELSDQEWLELAKVGIEAKRLKNNPLITKHRKESQEPFSIDAPVHDIEDFCNDGESLRNHDKQNPLKYRFLDLLNLASLGRNNHSIEFCNMFFDTRIGVALTELQMVLTEVNISRMQNCKKHQFVLKKVEEIGVYILIKPTRASEQIFFSVAIPAGSQFWGKPFKEFTRYGKWFISDFVSMDTNRLSHQIAAPERSCALLSFWCQQFRVQPLDFFPNRDEDITSHFLASLLFYLEDKEATSSSMQSFRYAYMEMIKGPDRKLDPFKILSKMKERPRSRLQVWATRKFITCFEIMLDKPPSFGIKESEDLADEATQDIANGLLSWVTCRDVKRFEICLNLCYFGVLHNKEEGDKVTGFLKIFEKVIEEERKLRECDVRYHGNEEPPIGHEYKSHEFSMSYVAASARTAKNFLKNKGSNSLKWLYNKIYETLASKDILEFATMKSSAEEFNASTVYHQDLEMNKRVRTTEAVKKLCDNKYDPNIMTELSRINKEVERVGGLQANLFKKMQIGGTREIFVLTINSRIIVNFVETVSRCICEELPNEMLTKGDQKLLKNDTHFKLMNTIHGSYSTTVSSSDDATTWAQKFVMKCFGCYLSNLIDDDDILIPMLTVLNHCTNKRLELPKELLDLFTLHPEVDSFSENINELKRQFLGVSDHDDLVDKHKCSLKNRSNMMQGIFHYTSSLYHAGFLLHWSNFASKIIHKRLKNQIKDHVITTKVSSDDSSVLISTRFRNYKDRPVINKVFLSLTILKKRLYKYICCKQSEEKSTVGVYWTIEEFNSTWLMRNTLVMPLIKFIVSSTQIHVAPRIESRLYTASTLRSQILENCGCMMIAAIVQVCQARLHYIAIGAANNRLWFPFKEYLLDKPHHVCGFFPLEPDVTCGLLGINHAMYNFYKENASAGNIQARLFKNQGVENSGGGYDINKVFLSYGQNTKYYSFLRNMGLSDKNDSIKNLEESLEPRVELLYRSSQSTEEALIKLLIKSSNPDLAQAFSYMNSSKIFASSSYLLQEKCIHLIKSTFESGEITYDKVSLMSWVKLVDNSPVEGKDRLFELNFPSWKLYDAINERLPDYDLNYLALDIARRRVFVTVPIPKQSSLTPLTIIETCRRLWFDHDVRGSKAAVEATFLYFKELYPWLSESYQETISKSPFSSHIALHKFLYSLTPISKTIRMTTPSRLKQSGFQTILDAIKRNQFPSRQIIVKTQVADENYSSFVDSFVQALWRVKNAPPVRDKNYLISKLCRSYPDLVTDNPNIVDIMTQGKMKFNALMLQCAVMRPTAVIPLMIKFNRGVFGGFNVPQKFDASKGYYDRGTFTGSIDGLNFSLDIKDDSVYCIRTESVSSFLQKTGAFNWFLRDMNLELNCKQKPGYNFFNGSSMLSSWCDRCCTIVETDVNNYFENKGVTFDCDKYGRIRIKTTSSRPITILSFVPGVKYIIRSDEPSVDWQEPLKSWMTDTSIAKETGYEYLTKGTLQPDLNEWIVRSFLKRLKTKHYRITVSDYDEIEYVPEEPQLSASEVRKTMDEMLGNDDDINIDDFLEVLGEMSGSEEANSDEEWDDEVYEYQGLLMKSDDYVSRQSVKSNVNEVDALSVSQFWDSTIQYLLDLSSFSTIEKAVRGDHIINPSLIPVKQFVNEIRRTLDL